jgi:hypothetical protein
MNVLNTFRAILFVGFQAAMLIGFVQVALAQGVDSEEDEGWSNSTDFSVVVAKGNANTENFSLDDTLHRHWDRSNFQLNVDLFKTSEADDRFLLIEPGLTWLPGETPPPGSSTVIEPPLETEAARFFVESKYDHEFKKQLYWSTGASWDRNEDAGILNRYIAFGGIGRIWREEEDFAFQTVWALSYTDREEDDIDPEKDVRFGGFRFSWEFKDKWGKLLVYKNKFKANMSLKDAGDYSLDMTNSFSVEISNHLSLKVSLQGLFEHEPALEDVDIITRAQLIDPDLIPGNGDEFFETVASGGTELTTGSDDIRKAQFDAIFKTSLTIKF